MEIHQGDAFSAKLVSEMSLGISKQYFLNRITQKNGFISIEAPFSSRIHNASTPTNTPINFNNCDPDLFEAKFLKYWIHA